MDYRNKLGVFTFDDDLSPTLMELVACTVMGQYFNPKPGEPTLTSPQSCYDYIRERCGNVLSAVGFDLYIYEKYWTPSASDAFVDKIKASVKAREDAVLERLQELHEKQLMQAFPGSWLVGPAAVQ